MNHNNDNFHNAVFMEQATLQLDASIKSAVLIGAHLSSLNDSMG